MVLSDYYDEFSGKSVSRSRGRSSIKEWKHGQVVKALREKLKDLGSHHKCQEVDLVVIAGDVLHLYEVKTGADTQSIYTGIGQLVFHGAALRRLYADKTVIKHLVVPISLKGKARVAFCEELDVDVVTYSPSNSGFAIHTHK